LKFVANLEKYRYGTLFFNQFFHRAVNWGIYPSNWRGEGINENLEGEYLE